MRVWTIVWGLVVVIIGSFVAVNWQVLSAQTSVDFVVAQVTAPLGLLMVGAMAALALLGLLFVVWLETRALLQLGRAGRDAQAAAALDALAGLRTDLDRQLGDLKAQTGTSADNLFARLDHLEQMVRDLSQRAGHGDKP